MHKPFDLEAAKRGELVEFRSPQTATKGTLQFVGMTSRGLAVVEVEGCASVLTVSPDLLSMAPKKVTVQYRMYLWKDDSGNIRPGIIDPIRAEGSSPEMGSAFVEWIHAEWQEAEVEIPQ